MVTSEALGPAGANGFAANYERGGDWAAVPAKFGGGIAITPGEAK